jgi:hypothetical protein
MTKVGKSSSGQTSKTKTTKTTTTIRRKSGTVASINRSRTDVFDNDVQDDATVVDASRDVMNMDDIYDFGSSPPRPAAAPRAHSSKRRPVDDPARTGRKDLAEIAEESEDASQRCYKELLALRDEVGDVR